MRPFRWLIPFFCLCLFLAPARAADREVNFLAMGDWGSNAPNQKVVADALAGYVQQSGKTFDGMLLAGDNFYVRLSGVDDPKWQTLFEEMYDPSILSFPFYVTLGNHDYEHGKATIERDYARINPQSRWKFPAPYYRLEIPGDKPIVTALMLNSNRQAMSDGEWRAQLYWIRQELAKPRKSTWLIAVAHHPLFSNGSHGDNGVLQRQWGPLFREGNVDMYIAGHDHDLQHLEIEDWPTSFLLVGGGGKTIRKMRNDIRGPFSRSSYGFAALCFTTTEARVRFVSESGKSLHEFRRTSDRQVEIVEPGISDPATPRTVRDITRPADVPATTGTVFKTKDN